MAIKHSKICPLQGLPKYSKFRIFGMKICHLATLTGREIDYGQFGVLGVGLHFGGFWEDIGILFTDKSGHPGC
jgi:hypothetical protein